MKLIPVIILALTFLNLIGCVESKKDQTDSNGASTQGKSFVSSSEIQVLNQVFENQFLDVGTYMLSGFTRFTGVSALEAKNSRGISYLSNWCQDFKNELIDDKVNSVFSSTCSSECDQNIDRHNITNCTTTSFQYSCDSEVTQNTVSNIVTNIYVDYSGYDSADRITVSGDISGSISGDDFPSAKSLDCNFTLNYVYGAANLPTCDIFDITCKIGDGADQTTAYCEHILPSTTLSDTISSCNPLN